jgi:hypothetical protein
MPPDQPPALAGPPEDVGEAQEGEGFRLALSSSPANRGTALSVDESTGHLADGGDVVALLENPDRRTSAGCALARLDDQKRLSLWDHLIYAYMIENTRIYGIFRCVLREFLHGEKLGMPGTVPGTPALSRRRKAKDGCARPRNCPTEILRRSSSRPLRAICAQTSRRPGATPTSACSSWI